MSNICKFYRWVIVEVLKMSARIDEVNFFQIVVHFSE